MSHTVVATFLDAQAARRAAVALGRAELAAGPTRVQTDASAPERGALLELRVEASDRQRAVSLMREHGAAIADPACADGHEPDAGGADARGAAVASAPIWGNAPSHGQVGTGSGTHLSDTVAAGTASSMGQIGPGSSLQAAMGATDASGTASGTRTHADPATPARADDVPMDDPRPANERPRSES
ncbi:MAG: hypothetical protein EHM87_18455 [Burkholderiales bacterium]|nr:MAG: hypothetical protein EHM87_18455 [Burkholderiales bacterium]